MTRRPSRLHKLAFMLIGICMVLVVMSLALSRHTGKRLLIAYPLEIRFMGILQPYDIGILDPDTGREFTFRAGSLLDADSIRAAPTGQILYFKAEGFYLTGLNGSGRRRLDRISSSSFERSAHAAWSPDGSHIAFLRGDGLETSDLYVMDADGSNPRLLTHNLFVTEASWSPDGSRLVLTARPSSSTSEGSEIYVVTLDGVDVRKLTYNRFGDFTPQWSPDGKRILAVAARDGGYNNIYVMTPEGQQLEVLAQGLWPQWVMRGNYVVYTRTAADDISKVSLVLKDLESGHSTELFSATYLMDLQVSPDGYQLLYSMPDSRHPGIDYVCTFNLDTHVQTCFTAVNKFSIGVAVWLPVP
jgi:Tol biopolymer transport system component